MHTLTNLNEFESVSLFGGTAGENDSLARDLGQFVGGYYGFYVAHPFLAFLPFGIGSGLADLAGIQAAMQ